MSVGRGFVRAAALLVLAAFLVAPAQAERRNNGPDPFARVDGESYFSNESGRAKKRSLDFDFGLFGSSRNDVDVFGDGGGGGGLVSDNDPEEGDASLNAPITYEPERVEPLRAKSFSAPEPIDALAAAIRRELLSKETVIRVTAAEKAAIISLYEANGFAPLWTFQGGLGTRGQQVLAVLAASEEDGMDPLDYLPPALGSFDDNSRSFAGDSPRLANLDLGLTAVALKYARHASGGRLIANRLTRYNDITPPTIEPAKAMKALAWSPFPAEFLKGLQPSDRNYGLLKAELAKKRAELGTEQVAVIGEGNRVKQGESDPRVPLLRMRLAQLGYFDADGTVDDTVLDPALVTALREFQRAAKIKSSGRLDQATVSALNDRREQRDIARLIFSMERMRWLPRNLGQRYVLVNQASFQVEVIERGKEIWRSNVIVGKPGTQTVAFSDEFETVVFNPTWGVPASIIRKEMLPKLRRNPGYFDRIGWKVVAPNGKVVKSRSVNWWRLGKNIPYSVIQPPGDDNALGEVKFLFPNKHNIYMHDTPARELFTQTQRAFSHGCVRVENPRLFAEVLLGWPADKVAESIDDGVSKSVKITTRTAVHLTYFTAWPDASGRIAYYDDLYERDAAMERAFNVTAVAAR
jgi:murein L,D-transpeptidase YcbB/YkuD